MSSNTGLYEVDIDTENNTNDHNTNENNINLSIHGLNAININDGYNRINIQNRLSQRRGGISTMASTDTINILLIGCGGREHAYYSSLKNSSKICKFYCYTGQQSGIDGKGIRNPAIQATYINSLSDIEDIKHTISFAIVGPEKFLADGIVDDLRNMRIPSIGPSKNLAQIETSKNFARTLLNKLEIIDNLKTNFQYDNTDFSFSGKYNPKYMSVDQNMSVSEITSKIWKMLDEFGYDRLVLKQDGLASGKGVQTKFSYSEELLEYVFSSFRKRECHRILIEEKLIGQEFTLMSFSDGNKLIHTPIVVDYKVSDPINPVNTGGFGSVLGNPSDFGITNDDIMLAQKINQYVVDDLHKNTAINGEKYIGILYGSFIKTKNGIKVIEYNARGGDSEIINVLDNMSTPFIDVCLSMIKGNICDIDFDINQSVNRNTSTNLFMPEHYVNVVKYYVPIGYPNNVNDLIKMIPLDISFLQKNNNDGKSRLGLNCYQKGGIIMSGLDFNKIVYGDTITSNYCYLTGSRTIAILGRGRNVSECLETINQIYSYILENTKGFHSLDGIPLLESSNIIGRTYAKSNSNSKSNSEFDINTTDNLITNSVMTYSSAGVDDDKVGNILKRCMPNIKATHGELVGASSAGKGGGGYYGEYENLLSSIDGVGTKSIFALKFSKDINMCMANLAQDLFYAVYNDILVGGCLEPMFFLDYFGGSSANMDLLEPFVMELSKVCKKHNCALLGGETATMEDMYRENINLIGMIVGRRSDSVNWTDLAEGHYIYGFESNGPHANGYTLIRKVIDKIKKKESVNYNLETNTIPDHIINALLAPTKDYTSLVKQFNLISGMAHITGGGFNNIERILPKDLDAVIDCNMWDIPECFEWLEYMGDIPSLEMYRVFNMGIGFIVISPEKVDIPQALLIGKVERGTGTSKFVNMLPHL